METERRNDMAVLLKYRVETLEAANDRQNVRLDALHDSIFSLNLALTTFVTEIRASAKSAIKVAGSILSGLVIIFGAFWGYLNYNENRFAQKTGIEHQQLVSKVNSNQAYNIQDDKNRDTQHQQLVDKVDENEAGNVQDNANDSSRLTAIEDRKDSNSARISAIERKKSVRDSR